MSTMATSSPYLAIREAARRLNVHENTVRRYADRGLVRTARLPSGVRRVLRADVDALADRPARRPDTTVGELLVAVGAEPVRDVAALARPELWDSDEEAQRFIAMTLAERRRDR
jgi:excisionase family DNA binding protein